ncbi:MAG: hypothetical protein AABY13_01890, partial [Nanoarchaeota archaeon]
MVKHLKVIDPHVHFRWEEYPDNNYLKLGFEHAKAVGICAVVEQPNTKPGLENLDAIKKRTELADGYRGDIKHRIHIGLTNNRDQVRQALCAVMDGAYGLRSCKTFLSDSTGDTGVKHWDDHKMIWDEVADIGYNRIWKAHFENENLFVGTFDPKDPITHSFHRPETSETTQFEAQARLAYDARFQGTMYVAHVSSTDTVDLAKNLRKFVPFEIVLETTWHHMFLNWNDYKYHGNNVKMNPPLRSPEQQEKHLEYVLRGEFQVIGGDHAPHTPERKQHAEKPASGVPTLIFIPKGIERLQKHGINEAILNNMLFHNANRLFEFGIRPQ